MVEPVTYETAGHSVAIIGSFRQYYDEVLAAWTVFRAAHWVVTSPLGSTIIEAGIPFVRFLADNPDWDDATVQTVALHRILRADLTYVVAPSGYVGRTTCYELGRVLQARRPVYFSAQPDDLPLAVPAEWITSPAGLVRRFRQSAPDPIFHRTCGRYAEWERRLCSGTYLDA